MFTQLYNMIISPLVTILEFFYMLFYKICNKGVAVIGLSFVVTLLTLPLYMVAEKWQEEERNTQKKLKSGIERIKQTFTGDEQYMMLSTFYRQNHYHPIFALRSSFSLLIQIPFFMAAYNFLSTLEPLKGYSFLFIRNFGAPDAMFTIKDFSINVLPIAMTLINCVAGFIYSKGHPLSEKVQIYACAAVFLILLYNSPAGLVLYWTMNNVLSLVKNIFYKIKHPKKVIYIITCSICALLILSPFTILQNKKLIFKLVPLILGIIIPLIPFIIKPVSKLIDSNFTKLDNNSKLRFLIFIFSAFMLSIIAGLYIPSTLIQSEPEQFCYVDSYKSPWIFLVTPSFQALGFFLFWPICFYFLFSDKIKKLLAILFPILAFSSIINCIAFSGNYGPLQQDLVFMIPQSFLPSFKEFILNSFVLIFIAAAILLLILKIPKLVNNICLIFIFAFTVICCRNIIGIHKEFKKMPQPTIMQHIEPIFHLSKTGKNVLIIMQDRLFSPYVMEALKERPELYDIYSGFTFYKNTTSMGPFTMLGTPGIYGGYDYTPYEINKRLDKTLQQKHNEALLSMPVYFLQQGWNTTVSDLPYENYLEYPVTQMYKEYPQIERHITKGVYSDYWCHNNNMERGPYTSTCIKRNFIWFSIFKMVPPILRTGVYGREYWISWYPYETSNEIIDNFAQMDYLPDLFDSDSEKNSLVLFDNELTHKGEILDYPEYKPVEKITQYGKGRYAKNGNYHTAMAAIIRIGNLIEKLKADDIYDNTRIIIVSDHALGDTSEYFNFDTVFDYPPAQLSACLLVKDFNSQGQLKESMEFMTNADTTAIATEGISENPCNPFTNNPFKVKDKNSYVKISTAQAESTRIRNNPQFKIADNQWVTVKDDIYKAENWSFYEK